ncbi:DNA-J protein, putative [Bodo saltans]|uniref:DNA-J protein, putative n=1 Tax=Bodo saltans TaxID=75058 RepID=A0A0S4IZJ3_BODSA|nr:DNA-J protein, putative [Bodo saltans]|eukprot:CUG30760.1 DNA-J protein, putative [Bodo saltans]
MITRTSLLLATYEEINLAAHTMGVSVKCSAKELKDRYKELVRVHHPDTGGDPVMMSQITSAHDLLSKMSPFERDQFTTRARFDRSERHFSSFHYAYTYATVPRFRTNTKGHSVRSKSIVLFNFVPDTANISDFSRKCTIAGFLFCAYVFFVGVWNANSLFGFREVYHANDIATNARLIVLHEERQKLNRDISNLRMTIKLSVHTISERADLSAELDHLLSVRQMLNEEIERCIAPVASHVTRRHNDSSATLSPGLSIGVIALILLLPRFCRVANFSAR